MRPELRICVKIFEYRQESRQEPRISSTTVSSMSQVPQCSPIRHVRQESRQQFRLCVTFNNAMLAVQLVTSSRISSKKTSSMRQLSDNGVNASRGQSMFDSVYNSGASRQRRQNGEGQ